LRRGRLDAYREPGRDIYDWFAGAHLVEEAGGALSDCAGAAFGFGADGIVAGSVGLHTALIGLVK
jgi:fructose-1,6-bisphosphatase/inositol monophosphatase family enzyme